MASDDNTSQIVQVEAERRTQLIRLDDGFYVEADVSTDEVKHVSSTDAPWKGGKLSDIQPLLTNVCRPVVDTWRELNREMDIDAVEVEVGLSFEGEGNLYIAKAKTGANLKVTLKLKSPRQIGADPSISK